MFGIGEAVKNMKMGEKVQRSGWNGKNMYIFLVSYWSSTHTPMHHLPFVAMKTADEKIVPWLCSQSDLLAEDWDIYKPL